MAKWGEGDPRWIVEERADAKNVNNWHWTEKNASNWSKEKLKSLLDGFIIEDECYFCEIKELTKIEGDASASNRKAKLIFFYEWEITADWKGKLKSSDTSYNGKFTIPNLSDENDADEVDVNVTITSDKDEAYKVKDFMRVKGEEKIRDQLALYIKQLREEFSKDMILPSKNNVAAKPAPPTAPSENVAKKEMNKTVEGIPAALGVKISCKKYSDKTEFKCTASELYRVFTDPGMVRAFSRADCEVDATKSGRFVMFGGNVSGEFTDLVLDEKLSMRWRFKSWPAEHYSNVTLLFEQKDDCTLLKLSQSGVPESDLERTKSGWQNYYWQSIKGTFGYGTTLF